MLRCQPGTVSLRTAPGRGTTVRIRIPLTLAIIPALVVTAAANRFAIPQVNLLELVRLDAAQAATAIENVHGAPVYRLRGRLLPLVDLRGFLFHHRGQQGPRSELDRVAEGRPAYDLYVGAAGEAHFQEPAAKLDIASDGNDIAAATDAKLVEPAGAWIAAVIARVSACDPLCALLRYTGQLSHSASEAPSVPAARGRATVPDYQLG